ncbi:MAG: hypothetical protein M3367_04545 [Acidobacteriota bacterium]|nr:hypothetical protein [Acidobacteriota bacterium]
MLKIQFYIPQTTIELENSRNPDKLTMDELLYWTFETEIEFIDTEANSSLLSIPEAAFFQIIRALSNARRQFVSAEKVEIFARDREGSYDLIVKKKEEIIEICDNFHSIEFQVDLVDFIKAVEPFIKSAFKELEAKFPKLLLNKNYQELKAIL